MISNVYAIYDSGAKSFESMLIVERSNELAQRRVQGFYEWSVQLFDKQPTAPETKYAKYPQCFSLVSLVK